MKHREAVLALIEEARTEYLAPMRDNAHVSGDLARRYLRRAEGHVASALALWNPSREIHPASVLQMFLDAARRMIETISDDDEWKPDAAFLDFWIDRLGVFLECRTF